MARPKKTMKYLTIKSMAAALKKTGTKRALAARLGISYESLYSYEKNREAPVAVVEAIEAIGKGKVKP